MKPAPSHSVIHSSVLAPFHLEERVQIGTDNRQRQFVKWRTYYIKRHDGQTVCIGTNEAQLRHVLVALIERGGGTVQWTHAVSPASAVRTQKRSRHYGLPHD